MNESINQSIILMGWQSLRKSSHDLYFNKEILRTKTGLIKSWAEVRAERGSAMGGEGVGVGRRGGGQ